MSVVNICNIGLSRYLGYQRMNAITEESPQAEECNLHYDALRKSLLEMHWWDFAKERVALAEVTNDRPDEWDHKYERPADVLDIHWVNDPDVASALILQNKNPDCERVNFREYVYCNVNEAWIEYTRDEDTSELFPQYFRDALSAMIAAAVAMPLTESVSRAKFAGEQATIKIDNAIAMDEDDQPPIEMPLPQHMIDRGVT